MTKVFWSKVGWGVVWVVVFIIDGVWRFIKWPFNPPTPKPVVKEPVRETSVKPTPTTAVAKPKHCVFVNSDDISLSPFGLPSYDTDHHRVMTGFDISVGAEEAYKRLTKLFADNKELIDKIGHTAKEYGLFIRPFDHHYRIGGYYFSERFNNNGYCLEAVYGVLLPKESWDVIEYNLTTTLMQLWSWLEHYVQEYSTLYRSIYVDETPYNSNVIVGRQYHDFVTGELCTVVALEPPCITARGDGSSGTVDIVVRASGTHRNTFSARLVSIADWNAYKALHGVLND